MPSTWNGSASQPRSISIGDAVPIRHGEVGKADPAAPSVPITMDEHCVSHLTAVPAQPPQLLIRRAEPMIAPFAAIGTQRNPA